MQEKYKTAKDATQLRSWLLKYVEEYKFLASPKKENTFEIIQFFSAHPIIDPMLFEIKDLSRDNQGLFSKPNT